MLWFLICLAIKKSNSFETQLLFRGRKLNVYLVFIEKYYFNVPINIRLNSTHYLIMKIANKRDLQQKTSNNLSDIGFEDFMNLYRKSTARPYSLQ